MKEPISLRSDNLTKKVDLSQPPKAFEEFNRVSGISGQYIFPRQLSAKEYEQELRANHFDIWDYYSYIDDRLILTDDFPLDKLQDLRRLKNELTRLNPELKSIDCNENIPYELFDVIFGVASGINPVDIAFFIEKRNVGAPNLQAALQDSEYKTLYDQINNHPCTRVKISWVPSKQTLVHIDRQMQSKVPTP